MYFPLICKLDSLDEVDDQEAWHKAIPSMEYVPILAHQILQDYLRMHKLPSKKPEVLTKRFNLPSRNEEETVASWDNILRCCYLEIKKKNPRPTPNTQGKTAIVAIDYADDRDFASAGVLTEQDGEYTWSPPPRV